MMNSLILGSKSSPCRAIYINNTKAMEFLGIMPNAVSAIINNTYMDDFLLNLESVDSKSLDCGETHNPTHSLLIKG